EQERADELFEWIKKDRVSCVENRANLTPVDVALAKFREFTQNYTLIEVDETSFQNRRCCLFMLLNYLKVKKGSQNTTLGNCCDKHSIIAESAGKKDDDKK